SDFADGGAFAIVTGQVRPTAIAVDPAPCGRGAIYWTTDPFDPNGGGVFTATKDGGNVHRVSTGFAYGIAASSSHAVWAASDSVLEPSVDGGGDPVPFAHSGGQWEARYVSIFGEAAAWGGDQSLDIFGHDVGQPCTGGGAGGCTTHARTAT